MEFPDALLVTRCLDGDTKAFEQLVKRYQSAVYATAFYYAGRYGAAEDIAQEAFWAAYRSLPRLEKREQFGPWLKEVTKNTATNWLRKHAKRLKIETPLPHRRTISIEDARQRPGRRLERKEMLARVEEALDTLPERYRLPVVLRYLQEQSYEEISAFTGESREEIRGILQRAGRQLRELLADVESEGDSEWHRARS